jgi:hypothetical protein
MVDEAYLDKEEWIKKSIRTTAKVRHDLKCVVWVDNFAVFVDG